MAGRKHAGGNQQEQRHGQGHERFQSFHWKFLIGELGVDVTITET
jgi:hypothetical protein